MKVLIANKYPLFRLGLVKFFKGLGGYDIIETETLQQAKIEMLNHQLDLCLIDGKFGFRNTLEELDTIRALIPAPPIVILTEDRCSFSSCNLLKYKVQGCIALTTDLSTLEEAVKNVLNGKKCWQKGNCQQDSNNTACLSNRQLEVLRLVYMGLQNKNIASTLLISEGTVRIHLTDIYRTLSVRNRTEAVHKAIDMGLIK